MSRSRAAARDAGAALERATADHLAVCLGDDRIDRRVRNGTLDRGDVGGVRTPDGARVVLECKDVRAMSLGAWVQEAERERLNDGALVGVVVHKRRGVGLNDPRSVGRQFVTLTVDDFVALLTGARPIHETPDTSDLLKGLS